MDLHLMTALDAALVAIERPPYSERGADSLPEDSFGIVHLLMHLEDRGISIPDAAIESMRHPTDLIAVLERITGRDGSGWPDRG